MVTAEDVTFLELADLLGQDVLPSQSQDKHRILFMTFLSILFVVQQEHYQVMLYFLSY